jgi:fumarylacetoacetase
LTERFSSAEWRKTSWVESANEAGSGFPLQSLPYCVFTGADGRSRIGVGIGSLVLDLNECSRNGLFDELPTSIRLACEAQVLNSLISCGAAARARLRARLMVLLDSQADQSTREIVGKALISIAGVALLKPVMSANYTDFYASIHHATRVGRLFRPEQPLLPNYKSVPIGYHGRASSLVVSGTPVRRPRGQTKSREGDIPCFGPTRFLDYEIEVGVYVSGGNQLGYPIAIDAAGEVAFGICLLNDWSARDIQAWETQPLGPFLAKSFATSVSPWVVPMAALAPFRCAAADRSAGDPAPLPYLYNVEDQTTGGIDLTLDAFLLTPGMRAAGLSAHRLSRANLRDLYWTPAQLIAHHTSNGCNLLPGDLLATGTVSGEAEESAGCLLELTVGGMKPILLPNGESRRALEDGDEVILRGVCRRPGFPDVSLGECRGIVLAAV